MLRLLGANGKLIRNSPQIENPSVSDHHAFHAIPSSMLINANVVDNDLHLRALQLAHFRNGKPATGVHAKKMVESFKSNKALGNT